MTRQIVKGRKMIMEIALAPGVLQRSRSLAEAAAAKLATFMEKGAAADDHRLTIR
jgi:hypothetical protein